MKEDYIKNIDGCERRFYSPQIEFRKDGEEGVIEGIAAVVNSRTDLGWFEEEIKAGAFDDVMNDDVVALFNHDPNYPLARSTNGKGTLSLFITKEGDLGYRFKTPDISYAKDLEVAIREGIISKSSFAFRIAEEKWTYAENETQKDLRSILKLERLYDVAPVTYPAYQDTSVAARSIEQSRPKIKNTLKYRKALFNAKHRGNV